MFSFNILGAYASLFPCLIPARRLRCRDRIYYPDRHRCCFNRYLRPRHHPCRGHLPRYTHVGCFKDRHRRALAVQLGTFHRHIAVKTCARLAWRRGFRLFSVQYGGQCFSGPVAYRTYYRYGRGGGCRHGTGGTWRNDVYFFNGEHQSVHDFIV